jgi:hypothetical protein
MRVLSPIDRRLVVLVKHFVGTDVYRSRDDWDRSCTTTSASLGRFTSNEFDLKFPSKWKGTPGDFPRSIILDDEPQEDRSGLIKVALYPMLILWTLPHHKKRHCSSCYTFLLPAY